MKNFNLSISKRVGPGVGPNSQFEFYRVFGKRVFDIIVTLLILPFVLPLIGISALLIALSGSMPFYSQDQIGKNGRIYRAWKLRLMVKNADVCATCDEPDCLDDSRLTSFGLFLRKSSLDELPLFFNVLIGDMSLVGPRPMVTSPTALYPGGDYHDLQPGITGLCQTLDRPYVAPLQRAACDAQYNRSLSLENDLAILNETFKFVLRQS